MKKDQITIELLMRTVFEMKRTEDYRLTGVKDLARPAYELLRELERTIAHFEEDECTFKEGVKIVTGVQRVREEQIRKFELFYEQTYALDLDIYRGGDAHQFYKWRTNDSMPLRWCAEAAPKFAKWNALRRSEIERQKRIGSAKPKWDEKIEASSKQKAEDF